MNCTICGHQAEPDGQLQCDCSLPDHFVDANDKPWASEQTPVFDAAFKSGEMWWINIRDLERRMRAAERLLAVAVRYWRVGYANAERQEADAHLEAARKEYDK